MYGSPTITTAEMLAVVESLYLTLPLMVVSAKYSMAIGTAMVSMARFPNESTDAIWIVSMPVHTPTSFSVTDLSLEPHDAIENAARMAIAKKDLVFVVCFF